MALFSSVKVMSTSKLEVAAYDLGLDTTKIVYRRHEDQVWKPLCGGLGETCTYYDVVCCDRKNTVFALGAGPSVESWDFNETVPTKTTIIQGRACPRTLAEAQHRFPTDVYDSRASLCSTPLGQIFLVVSYAADPSGSTLDHVLGFRLDLDLRAWVEVEWCNYTALFVGLNDQTVFVPAFGDEVVFFSNDYWESSDGFGYGVLYGPPLQMIKEEEKKEEEEEEEEEEYWFNCFNFLDKVERIIED